MKILDHKDAINRRQDEELIIVETAIYRVSCLNRTVLTGTETTTPVKVNEFCVSEVALLAHKNYFLRQSVRKAEKGMEQRIS